MPSTLSCSSSSGPQHRSRSGEVGSAGAAAISRVVPPGVVTKKPPPAAHARLTPWRSAAAKGEMLRTMLDICTSCCAYVMAREVWHRMRRRSHRVRRESALDHVLGRDGHSFNAREFCCKILSGGWALSATHAPLWRQSSPPPSPTHPHCPSDFFSLFFCFVSSLAGGGWA